jgi:hypothetical protein
MKMNEITAIAKTYGIVPDKLSKTDLIKTIQTREGNFDCFATAYNGECDQIGCCWREECFTAARQTK